MSALDNPPDCRRLLWTINSIFNFFNVTNFINVFIDVVKMLNEISLIKCTRISMSLFMIKVDFPKVLMRPFEWHEMASPAVVNVKQEVIDNGYKEDDEASNRYQLYTGWRNLTRFFVISNRNINPKVE